MFFIFNKQLLLIWLCCMLIWDKKIYWYDNWYDRLVWLLIAQKYDYKMQVMCPSGSSPLCHLWRMLWTNADLLLKIKYVKLIVMIEMAEPASINSWLKNQKSISHSQTALLIVWPLSICAYSILSESDHNQVVYI